MLKINQKISKAVLDNKEFVRVSNLDDNGEIINISVYLKEDNKYIKILPQNINYDIANKLSLATTYEEMNNEEIEQFKKDLYNNKLDMNFAYKQIKNIVKKVDNIIIDNAENIHYLLFKDSNINCPYLFSYTANKNGFINDLLPLTDKELPYVLSSIISKKHYLANSSKTFLINNNKFVNLNKEDDKYLIMVFELNIGEKDQLSLSIINLITLIEKDNNHIAIFDEEHELFFNLEETKISKIIEDIINYI